MTKALINIKLQNALIYYNYQIQQYLYLWSDLIRKQQQILTRTTCSFHFCLAKCTCSPLPFLVLNCCLLTAEAKKLAVGRSTFVWQMPCMLSRFRVYLRFTALIPSILVSVLSRQIDQYLCVCVYFLLFVYWICCVVVNVVLCLFF